MHMTASILQLSLVACRHCVHGRHEGESRCWHPQVTRGVGVQPCAEVRSEVGICGPEAVLHRLPSDPKCRPTGPGVDGYLHRWTHQGCHAPFARGVTYAIQPPTTCPSCGADEAVFVRSGARRGG